MRAVRKLAMLLMLAVFCCPAQSLEGKKNFLVKLRTPIGTKISRAGQPVEASVISPESFLGALMEGKVTSIDEGLRVTFHAIRFKGRSIEISTETTDFVNSKGHKNVDDENRPARIQDGRFVSPSGSLWIDEGAEFRLAVTPSSR